MKQKILNLLLVEDSLIDAKIILSMLSKIEYTNFKTDHVETLADAKKYLQKKKFDLIILDLMLPDSDALDTFNTIKTKSCGTPIIILTSIDDNDNALNSLANGAQDYLIKGCLRKDLLSHSILYAIERNQLMLKLKNKLKELDLLKTRLEYIIQSNPAVIYTKNIDKMHDFVFISENMKKIFGYDPEQFIKDQSLWQKNIHPEDLSRIKPQMESLSLKRCYICEYRFQHKNGEWRWVHDEARVARDEEGKDTEVVGYLADITERKQLDENIKHYAMYDQLTDLPNRRLFMDRAEQAIARARREQKGFALLYIDLDKFKPINDTFGHTAGDAVLQEVASRMKAMVRSTDTVARIGGDEFAIILQDLENIKYAGIVAQKLINSIIKPISLNKNSCSVGASIGISYYPIIASDIDTLLLTADNSMYKAKLKGGNRFEYSVASSSK